MTNMTDPPIPADQDSLDPDPIRPTDDTVDQGDTPEDEPLF